MFYFRKRKKMGNGINYVDECIKASKEYIEAEASKDKIKNSVTRALITAFEMQRQKDEERKKEEMNQKKRNKIEECFHDVVEDFIDERLVINDNDIKNFVETIDQQFLDNFGEGDERYFKPFLFHLYKSNKEKLKTYYLGNLNGDFNLLSYLQDFLYYKENNDIKNSLEIFFILRHFSDKISLEEVHKCPVYQHLITKEWLLYYLSVPERREMFLNEINQNNKNQEQYNDSQTS